MTSGINFTTVDLWLLGILVFLGIAGLIFGMRQFITTRSKQDLTNKYKDKKWASPLEARSKYPDVDVFRYRDTIFRVSMAIVLLLIVAGMNYTSFEKDVYIPDNALVLEEDIEIEPPRTQEAPPPPPPPPPTVFNEVPDEMITEDDSPEFVDQSISEDTYVDAEPVVEKKEVAPPPPPPPPPKKEVEEIFKVVEEMPRFPGCEDLASKNERTTCANQKLLEFVYKNIKYPNIARENGVEGMVVVQFVVEKDGSIGEARVVRDIGGQCGDEALRIVRMMPKWIAGQQRGRAVRVMFNLPIKFELRGNQS